MICRYLQLLHSTLAAQAAKIGQHDIDLHENSGLVLHFLLRDHAPQFP
jgi:hypothetical protein